MSFAYVYPNYENLFPEDLQNWENATPEQKEEWKNKLGK